MSDKILYTGGPNPFKGLIGMPEEPEYCQGFDDRYCELCNNGTPLSCSFKKFQHYHKVESIKSNAPDIVNPELVMEECDQCDGCGWYEGGPTLKTTCAACNGFGHRPKGYNKFQPGDTFPLPEGYEFVQWKNKTIKIVPKVSHPEPEESQKELWDEAVRDMFEEGNEFVEKNWFIQRKK